MLSFTVVVILALAFAVIVLFRELEERKEEIQKAKDTARLLCRRQLITIDLTNSAIALINQRLAADMRKADREAVDADLRFLETFRKDRRQLIKDLTHPSSACVLIRK